MTACYPARGIGTWTETGTGGQAGAGLEASSTPMNDAVKPPPSQLLLNATGEDLDYDLGTRVPPIHQRLCTPTRGLRCTCTYFAVVQWCKMSSTYSYDYSDDVSLADSESSERLSAMLGPFEDEVSGSALRMICFPLAFPMVTPFPPFPFLCVTV